MTDRQGWIFTGFIAAIVIPTLVMPATGTRCRPGAAKAVRPNIAETRRLTSPRLGEHETNRRSGDSDRVDRNRDDRHDSTGGRSLKADASAGMQAPPIKRWGRILK